MGRGLCQAIRPDGDTWLVSSPQGEVRVRYRTDEALGVIDFHLSPAPVHMRLLTGSSVGKLGGVDGFPDGVRYSMEWRVKPPHGSNASQALRTRSIRRTNRGSPRRFARNGSYWESHGKLMKPNSTARSRQSIAWSRSFTSAKQSASHQEKISSHCAAARSSGVTMPSSFS